MGSDKVYLTLMEVLEPEMTIPHQGNKNYSQVVNFWESLVNALALFPSEMRKRGHACIVDKLETYRKCLGHSKA